MKVPRATYRLQLRPGFGFDEAARVAPYLAELGVSHAYFSPYLQAAPGSQHGYDVVDPSRVNAELGGDDAHARLLKALGEARLGQVLDVVPNHMAIGRENRWWWDLLENGASSRYALYFDVAWDPPEAKLRNTILMPVLGDHYGRELEAGQLRLEREEGTFVVRYFEHAFPVSPASLGGLLEEAARRSSSEELTALAAELAELPVLEPSQQEAARERHRRKEGLRERLAELCRRSPEVAEALDAVTEELSSDPDRLDALLEAQNYRLARWRTAGYELDYRRFFDVSTLAAVRTEDERVFQDTHELVLRWLEAGVLDGIRVDHPDGLRDPEQYFRRLREAAPDAWIVAEKILEPGERLPASWPVAGTTGYDFGRRALGLLVDPAGEEPLSELYAEFTGQGNDYRALVHDCKQLVMRDLLGADVSRLAELLVRVCEETRRYRDFARAELVQAVRELIACLPVYRTYVTPRGATEDDRREVAQACEEAIARRPELDPELLRFLQSVLLLDAGSGEVREEFVARFQQTSGPVMAKGVEDTALYRYNRLVALNEVGGDPSLFSVTPEEFHAASEEQAREWPAAMLSTSTHDTKRSEDVRARLAVLSERPGEWAEAVRRWSRLNERHRREGMPDRNDEYLLYQTLLGAWPITAERATAYMEKATKEAKLQTSWINPSQAYDAAVRGFTEAVLADPGFREDLDAFAASIADAGWANSLALKLLALTSPGVPDLYQGSELWDLSLVDPDNRREVDFELRRSLLDGLDGLDPAAAWERRAEGLPKLLVVKRALELRSRRPSAFAAGAAYRPLASTGPRARHAFGFLRGEEVAVLVTRFPAGLAAWGETCVELPPGGWRDVLAGREVGGGVLAASELLAGFPVALLERAA